MLELNESAVLRALKDVVDPEMFVNVVDLGLIYAVKIEKEGERTIVKVDMTMTSPACPAAPELMAGAKAAVEYLEGVDEAQIKLVMDPPWTPDRLSEDARDQLGLF